VLAVALHLVAHEAGREHAVRIIPREVDTFAAHALAHLFCNEADRAGHVCSVPRMP
jgi:hypothetical protein